jgi:VIT1/CCC1 family predicted Fe2+/Mn2+ transporter
MMEQKEIRLAMILTMRLNTLRTLYNHRELLQEEPRELIEQELKRRGQEISQRSERKVT